MSEVTPIVDVGGTLRPGLTYKTTERYVYGWTDPRAACPTRITWRYKLRLWFRESLWWRVRRAYVRYRMRWTRLL